MIDISFWVKLAITELIGNLYVYDTNFSKIFVFHGKREKRKCRVTLLQFIIKVG